VKNIQNAQKEYHDCTTACNSDYHKITSARALWQLKETMYKYFDIIYLLCNK